MSRIKPDIMNNDGPNVSCAGYFIDESGNSSIPDMRAGRPSYFILSGLLVHPKKIDVINSRCADLLIKYDLKGIKELKYHGLIPKKGCIGNMEKSAMMHDILSIVISEKKGLF